MAVTDTIRPVSTRKAGAGVAVPSGTLHGVTSDNSDATYIDFNVADRGNNWSLRMASHTPPADHERHRLRGRIRIRSDAGLSATEDIDVGRADDDYIQYSTVPVTTSFTEQIGDWFQDASFGLAEPGALTDLNLGGGWPPDPSPGTVELRRAVC